MSTWYIAIALDKIGTTKSSVHAETRKQTLELKTIDYAKKWLQCTCQGYKGFVCEREREHKLNANSFSNLKPGQKNMWIYLYAVYFWQRITPGKYCLCWISAQFPLRSDFLLIRPDLPFWFCVSLSASHLVTVIFQALLIPPSPLLTLLFHLTNRQAWA